ncbi:MAG: alpha-(1-_3)-arabinofuranosyltransferase, partial [Acidimicrobiales bacterium]|nr:alpha-(1->3)-arabinofuranosyltransferase [Acidimicrobiales bacterium]
MIAYVPLLFTQPGWIGADTKTYLYLDPAKLLADAPYVWDSQIGMGTVTHQNIGYLFPMGPFYLLFDLLRAPDWVAQRLWLGTVMFLAAMGVRYLLRSLGFATAPVRNGSASSSQARPDSVELGGILVASLAYMLSPYLLDYAARISVILLPWVALPWLIAVTAKALRHGGWWYPSVFALIVLAVGGINATALIMIGFGPLLWVFYAVWVEREVTLSNALAAIGRIAALTVVTSLWWIAGLWAEGRYGLPVIRYTETYRAVAGSSNANEVLRGLGYWFFYGRDKLGPWIEPSVLYTTNLAVLTLSYALPVTALVSAALVRWRYRAYFLLLIVVGALIAVGGHPWERPSLLGGLFKEFTKTNAGLSLRSTPRAIPLVTLGTAVFLGAGVTAIGRWSRRVAAPTTAVAALLVILNLPPLWNGTMVAENLRRPESPTTEGYVYDYWFRVAQWLDGRSHDTRALEVPGADFASYIWGNTVDPITPGLMDRGYLARELFQWGSPQSAALLEAYDRRFQEGLAEPGAIAPIARLMGVGDVVLRADIKHERYRTARPEQMWDLLTHAPGLGDPVAFTDPIFYPRDPRQPLVDEIELGKPRGLQDPPRVAAFPVEDPLPIVRAQSARRPLLVAGDADGLVDAAAIGILHPEQATFFSASFAKDPTGFDRIYNADAELLVTDTNRKRAHRWGALRETTGYTERAGETPAVYDPSDQRLEVFPGAGDDAYTVSEQLGAATVRATAYGNPITFTPDDRAAMAFDGDPTTAWRVGAIDNPVGERISIELDEPITVDHMTFVQPLTNVRNRWIEQIRIHFDDGTSILQDLSYSSRELPGETVTFDPHTTRRIEVEITRDSVGRRPRYDGLSGVGFAEIVIPGVQVREVIRPPVDLIERVGASSIDHRLSYLFTRQRSSPAEPVRGDPEARIERIFSVPTERRFALSATARLSAHTPDAVLDRMLGLPDAQHGGVTATASAHLPASLRQRASAAIDGDPTTAWTSIYDKQEGHWLRFDLAEPVTFDHLDLTVLADFVHSIPTKLRIYADGHDKGVVELPKIGASLERGHTETLSVDTPTITGQSLRFVIEGSDDYRTIDWYTDRPIVLP